MTCDVAAVPRNWQPPPGDPQARQPRSCACSSVSSPWANRAPIDCTLPASSPSRGGSVTPPGTSTAGRPRSAASAIIIAGSPLSHVATPSTPLRVGNERARTPEHLGGVVTIGEAVHHADGALRAAVARIRAVRGEREAFERAQLFGRRLHQQADLRVTGVIAESARMAIRGAVTTLGVERLYHVSV